MKSILKTAFISALITFSSSSTALQHLNGLYLGGNFNLFYPQDIKNFNLPVITGVTLAAQKATMTNKMGFGGEVHMGVKYSRYSLEGAVGSSYFSGKKIKLLALVGAAGTTQQASIYTKYYLMLNGYVNFGRGTNDTESGYVPYVGVGVGRGQVFTRIKFFNSSGTFIQRTNQGNQHVSIGRVSVGFRKYLDSYSFWGVGYTYQRYTKIKNLGKGVVTHHLGASISTVGWAFSD